MRKGQWIVADGYEITRRYPSQDAALKEAREIATQVGAEILVSCPYDRVAFFVMPDGSHAPAKLHT